MPTSNCTPPTSPALAQTEGVTSGDSTMTVARKTPTRRRPTLSDVMPLTEWLAPYVGQVDNVCCIRTSDSSAKNFASMFDLGTRMRPDDPDFGQLREIGVELVQRDGEDLRKQWNVFELRRGSVPGGHGRALLGYCVVLGRTLFILYLATARKSDIPGPTPDQTRNAFTEALLTVLRALRPAVLYTPLVSRVFRNMDFAHQVMRTLRELRVRLHAEGQDVALDGDEGITGLLKSWFSAREADAIVQRLDSIEKNIYVDGDWYLGEALLPFTWRFKSRVEIDRLTGESRRVVESKHDLEVVPGSADVLTWFIREGAKRDVTNHQLGVGLGERGVRSRAPKHAPDYPPLNQLREPASGASSLMAEKWRTAWRTGIYRRSIKLKADLRPTLPELADKISEIENVDGSIGLYLDVETHMPAPDGGWGLTEKEWEDFEAIRFEATPQRIGRAASKGGTRRPLASLCSYLDQDAYWELSCRTSGANYHLLRVPRQQALDVEGRVLVVPKDWPATASLVCGDLHVSIGQAIAEAVNSLGDRATPLRRGPAREPVRNAEELRAEQIAAAQAAVLKATNRLRGIRKHAQELDGDEAVLDDERDARRAELKEDESDARADLATAKATLTKAESEPVQEDVVSARVVRMEADIADLRVAAAALIRTDYTAPVELNEVLARVLRDLRIWTIARGTAVMWTARLLVPLNDGTEAEVNLEAAKPIASVLSSRSTSAGRPANAASPDVLAGLFFDDGLSMWEIGDLRGIDGSGYRKSSLAKTLRQWLHGHQVTHEGRALAALDMPPALRRLLYNSLTARPGHDPALEDSLGQTYKSDLPWGSLWCIGDHHQAARRVIAVLQEADQLFTGLPAHEIAARANLRYRTVVALTRSDRTHGADDRASERSPVLGKNYGPGSSARDARLITARPCPHDDCLALVAGPGPGVLVPIWVPETSTPHAQEDDDLVGLICSTCRRLPNNPTLVFPVELVQPWVGGRRRKLVVDGRETYQGSHLDAVPVPVVATAITSAA